MRSAVSIVSAVLLAGIALSGCGAQEATKEATSSASSAATSALSSASATTSAPAAKPAGDRVAPAVLPAVVADRTYRGDSEGKPYSEYYAPDGTLRGTTGGQAYGGSWKVVGEQLCFTYPNGADSETDCYAVFKNGDAISWVDSDGKIVEATYVEGNPDKL